MAAATHVITSFNGGQVSKRLIGRTDLRQYFSSCEKLENCIPRPLGSAEYRPGFRYAAEVRLSNNATRVVAFQHRTEAYYVLEFGDRYIRFYRDRAQLQSGPSTPYQIDTPYLAEELDDLRFVQSNSVMYITHPNHAPRELTRSGDISWTLEKVAFEDGPYQELNTDKKHKLRVTNVTGSSYAITAVDTTAKTFTVAGDRRSEVETWDMIGVRGSTAGLNDGEYKVTAVTYDSGTNTTTFTVEGAIEDSTVDGNIRVPTTVKANRDTFSVQDGSEGTGDGSYRHVMIRSDLEGPNKRGWAIICRYVSAKEVKALVVNDFHGTSGQYRWRLGAFGHSDSAHPVKSPGWPRVAMFHQLRLWYANTESQPQTLWGSQIDDFTSFKFSNYADSVVEDDQALTYTLDTDRVNTIYWMASTNRGLAIGTDGGEALVPTDSDQTISASEPPQVRFHTYHGSRSGPRVVQAGSATIFVQKSGRKLRQQVFEFSADKLNATDLTKLSEDITLGRIKDIAFASEPWSVIWAITDSGELLSLTYVVEGEDSVAAWAKHPVGGSGSVESIAVVHDGGVDRLWAVVRRTINGQTKRYVEYLTDRFESDAALTDAFFVDCGLVYDGSAATTISGLDHLEGQTVRVLADGATQTDKTVSGGQITLDTAASKVAVGLGYDGVVRPLPIEPSRLPMDPRGRFKALRDVTLVVHRSMGGSAGQVDGPIDEIQWREPDDPLSTALALFTGHKRIPADAGMARSVQVEVRQTKPLPMDLTAMILELDMGGS